MAYDCFHLFGDTVVEFFGLLLNVFEGVAYLVFQGDHILFSEVYHSRRCSIRATLFRGFWWSGGARSHNLNIII